MAQGNGCAIPYCKYYGWLYDKAGKGCVCHHPDTQSESCPLIKKNDAATSPQTYPAPVIYPEPEEDAEEVRGDWYA